MDKCMRHSRANLSSHETDEVPLSFPEMIKEIDAAYSADTFFAGLKKPLGLSSL
jgi:hypothetical protein